jgi:mRNA-degrading endonuclease RelE of RelBE toxin-antitoxin system
VVKLKATKTYLKSLTEIEDFIFDCTSNVDEIKKFHTEHERIKEFIKQNPNTPAPHPNTGDQSWPFSNGNYRLFFKVVKSDEEVILYLLDVIDNRILNKSYYPNNSIPSYGVD